MWAAFWEIYTILCGTLLDGYGIMCFFYYVFSELPEKRRHNCFQFYKTYRKEKENENDDFGSDTDCER